MLRLVLRMSFPSFSSFCSHVPSIENMCRTREALKSSERTKVARAFLVVTSRVVIGPPRFWALQIFGVFEQLEGNNWSARAQKNPLEKNRIPERVRAFRNSFAEGSHFPATRYIEVVLSSDPISERSLVSDFDCSVPEEQSDRSESSITNVATESTKPFFGFKYYYPDVCLPLSSWVVVLGGYATKNQGPWTPSLKLTATAPENGWDWKTSLG